MSLVYCAILWFDGSYYGLFTSRGTDKLDAIDGKTVSTTQTTLMDARAWSYGVESGLTPNTDYVIKARVKNLPIAITDVLTSAADEVFVWTVGSIYTRLVAEILNVAGFIASVIGFGAAFIAKAKRSTRIPKVTRLLEFLVPQLAMPSVAFPVMKSKKKGWNITAPGTEVSELVINAALALSVISMILFIVDWYVLSIAYEPVYKAIPAILGFCLLSLDRSGF